MPLAYCLGQQYRFTETNTVQDEDVDVLMLTHVTAVEMARRLWHLKLEEQKVSNANSSSHTHKRSIIIIFTTTTTF
jgi:hypothetical protein